jgi:hypothetical protein
VHGRLRRVPRAVDLAALGQLAIVVDKYGLHEALGEHGVKWHNALQKENRDSGRACSRRFVWWLVVAWVFRRRRNFRTLTRLAQLNWDGPLGTGAQQFVPSGFPVPASVLGMSILLAPFLNWLILRVISSCSLPCTRASPFSPFSSFEMPLYVLLVGLSPHAFSMLVNHVQRLIWRHLAVSKTKSRRPGSAPSRWRWLTSL